MNSLPLHPAIVHLPLGLAVLMPLLAAGFGWAVWTGRVRPRAWLALVALQVLLVAAGLVAIRTGGAEEERVEAVVQERAIHAHEEAAEQFVWAAGLSIGLFGLVLVGRSNTAVRAATALSVAATLGVAALALRVGHAGGQLVYVHGAAAAYATPAAHATPAATGAGATAPAFDRDDDDRGGR
ncbi:MAG: hypothetical protein R2752_17235 [Vicinamibacterales bacterium]